MADGAILKQPKAIFSLEGAKKLFQEGLDELKNRHQARVQERNDAKEERKTEIAQSRYEKVREKMIYASAGYSKQAVESFNKIFTEYEKLTPAEKKEFGNMLASGIRTAEKAGDSGQKYAPLFDVLNEAVNAKVITWDKSRAFLELCITAGAGVLKLGNQIPLLGIVIDVAVNALKQGLFKAINERDLRSEAKEVFKDEKLVDSIRGIESDIQKLTEELDQEKDEWIKKAKNMKPKEFEEAFGKYVAKKIDDLNLNNISSRLVNESMGKKRNRKKTQEPIKNEKGEEQQTDKPMEQQETPKEIPPEGFTEEIVQGLE